jgi:predicted oxidoreductase
MLVSDQRPGTRVKHYDTSAAHVRASVERSLANLGVDVIDVLLIHRQDPLMDHTQLGASIDWLVTNQIELSLLHLAPFVDGQVAFAQRTKTPLMAWLPLAGGRRRRSFGTPCTVARREGQGQRRQHDRGRDRLADASPREYRPGAGHQGPRPHCTHR